MPASAAAIAETGNWVITRDALQRLAQQYPQLAWVWDIACEGGKN